MKYTLNDNPFTLTEESFLSLYEDGMDYFHSEVLPLYTDVVLDDPVKGIIAAFSDFLSNESPLQEDGEFVKWEDVIALGREFFFEDSDEEEPEFIQAMRAAGELISRISHFRS